MPLSLQALFFLSGWTGLVYEVIWAKYLALTLGSTAAAHTFVLSTFLGGMAAGYAALGRYADRHRNPLELYARLEIAIAVLGAVSPLLLGSRWGLAVIPVAAALMGGTLPALSRQGAVANLYFLNSIGASWGALCAAFVLIPKLGLDGSVWAAALVNAAVAAAALRLSRRPPPPVKRADPEPSLPPHRLFYAVAAASGFISLALEIAWIRMLALLFGSTVYSFAGMLAAFIAGVGAGSWVIGLPRVSRLPALRTLIVVQFISAAALMATLPFYERIAYIPLWLDTLIDNRKGLFLAFESAKFFMSFILMFIPAACFGMVPPLAAKAAVRDPKETGARVGAVFSWNAVGNVLGAAAAGLWLLPLLGMQGLFNAAVGLQVLLGIALLRTDRSLARRGLWISLAAGAAASFFLLTPAWNPLQMSFGGFRKRLPMELGYTSYRKVLKGFRTLYYKDGREATVSVVEYQPNSRALKVNGKTDASTSRDLRTQVLASQLPLLLHGKARDVLVIGHGSGITLGGALTHAIDAVDVVELSPEVIEADRWFAPYNGNALSDPRAAVHIEDGRSFLLADGKDYDVIISEPSNPWMAGVGALYTAEYYARAKQRLKPGGVMAQWYHFYEMNRWTLRMVLRTFASEFPNTSLWLTFTGDVLILGSNEPLAIDFSTLEQRMRSPKIAKDLARIRIDRPASLLALQMASDATVRRLAQTGPLNRDRFPLLEYAAPHGFFMRKRTNLLFLEEDGFRPERAEELALAGYLKARNKPLSDEDYHAIDSYHGAYRVRFRRFYAAQWLSAHPADARAYLASARAEDDALNVDGAMKFVAEGLKKRPHSIPLLDKSAFYSETAFFQNGDRKAARAAIAFLKRLPPSVKVQQRRAKLHRELGEFEEALKRLSAAAAMAEAKRAPNADDVWMDVAELALERDKGPLVLDALEHALKANPDNESARDLMKTLLEHFKRAG